jgi:hypothetical protein
MYGWLWEAFVTATALEIRLFGFLLVYRLSKENLVSARVISGLTGGREFGAHPWNTLSLGNRIRREWVLVEKTRWPRFIGITPKDANEFVHRLSKSGSP